MEVLLIARPSAKPVPKTTVLMKASKVTSKVCEICTFINFVLVCFSQTHVFGPSLAEIFVVFSPSCFFSAVEILDIMRAADSPLPQAEKEEKKPLVVVKTGNG